MIFLDPKGFKGKVPNIKNEIEKMIKKKLLKDNVGSKYTGEKK